MAFNTRYLPGWSTSPINTQAPVAPVNSSASTVTKASDLWQKPDPKSPGAPGKLLWGTPESAVKMSNDMLAHDMKVGSYWNGTVAQRALHDKMTNGMFGATTLPNGQRRADMGYPIYGIDSTGFSFNTGRGDYPRGKIMSFGAGPLQGGLVDYNDPRVGMMKGLGFVKPDEAIGSEFGYPIFKTNSKGQRHTMYPSDNLTGYPITSTDPKLIGNLRDIQAAKKSVGAPSDLFLSEKRGYTTWNAGGNITGWPVLYNTITMKGPITKFVMPGFLPAGNLTYDNDSEAIPRLKNEGDRFLEDSFWHQVNDKPAMPKSIDAPTPQGLGSSQRTAQGSILQAQMDNKRRRTEQQQIATSLGVSSGLLGDDDGN